MNRDRFRTMLSYIAFPLFITLLLSLGLLLRRELIEIFSTPERLRDWILSIHFAPLVFIAIQVLQVVVFFIPGEVPQIAGGYLFGMWLGSLLSIVGIIIGSTISFVLARLLGVPFVSVLFNRDKVERIRRISESPRARFTFFLLFLIPGIPKDILCYVAGLTPIGLGPFLLISTLGRVPGILGSALMGDAAAESRWVLAGATFFLAVVLFLLGVFFRARIQRFLERYARKK